MEEKLTKINSSNLPCIKQGLDNGYFQGWICVDYLDWFFDFICTFYRSSTVLCKTEKV